MQFNHVSVLKKEVIDSVFPSPDLLNNLQYTDEKTLFVVDATLGGAGHALAFLNYFKASEWSTKLKIHIFGFDRDHNALEYSRSLLEEQKKNLSFFDFTLFQENFSEIYSKFPGQKIHCIYADFGVSSPQLDDPNRGFSFLLNGPLDMRMDTKNTLTAADILKTYSESQLTQIFFEYGEEHKARKLAKFIVTDRLSNKLPLDSSLIFANYVRRILAYPTSSRAHPATRVFQALRIEVNNELGSISALLKKVPSFMAPLGRAAFISFHSLEDRLVKRAFRHWQKGKCASESLEEERNFHNLPLHIQMQLVHNEQGSFGRDLCRGGVVPSEQECAENPRARCARLRSFEFSG